jgi:hypothetical protein
MSQYRHKYIVMPSCRHCNGRRRGLGGAGRKRSKVTLAQVALLARHSTAGLMSLAVAVSIDNNTIDCLAVGLSGRFGRRFRTPPAGQIPKNAREALEMQRLAFPLATRRSSAVEGTKTGIDGSLVRLGAEFVCSRAEFTRVEGSVVSVI